MSQIVHICAPDGTRYERTFTDAATSDQILAALRHPDHARLCGRSRSVVRKDTYSGQDVPHPDQESPWVVHDPATVICVGTASPDGQFVETKRLAGPPATDKPKAEVPAAVPIDRK